MPLDAAGIVLAGETTVTTTRNTLDHRRAARSTIARSLVLKKYSEDSDSAA
jgi:hypothetical protein